MAPTNWRSRVRADVVAEWKAMGYIVRGLLVLLAILLVITGFKLMWPQTATQMPVAVITTGATQPALTVSGNNNVITVNGSNNAANTNPMPTASPMTSNPPATAAQNNEFMITDLATYCPTRNYLGPEYYAFVTSNGRVLELIQQDYVPILTDNAQYSIEYIENGEGASTLEKAVPTGQGTGDCYYYGGGS